MDPILPHIGGVHEIGAGPHGCAFHDAFKSRLPLSFF
jgi:hypothetical protein